MNQNGCVYLLVDGENIDRTLGQILESKPKPEQRPRWGKIRKFVEVTWKKPCKALFFLNAERGLPGSFIQALKVAQYEPVALTGSRDRKIVDAALIKTLEQLRERPIMDDVVLASHDNDFKAALSGLSNRRIGVLAFKEYLSGSYDQINDLEVYDLEDDVHAFDGSALPRTRVIEVDNFDPNKFL